MPEDRSVPTLEVSEHGVYLARWYVRPPGATKWARRRHSLHTKDRAEAERLFGAFLSAGGHIDQRGAKPGMTVAEVAAIYLDRQAANGGSVTTQRLALAAPLRAMGTLEAGRIEAQHAEDFRDKRLRGLYGPPDRERKPVSPATVRRELNALQAAINAVLTDRALRLPKPTESARRVKWLREDAAKAMLTALEAEDVRLRAFARMALFYGARKGAIMELEWAWGVDLDEGMIQFQPPHRRVTRKRRPHVAITPDLRADLLELHEATGGVGRVLVGRVPEMFTAFCRRHGIDATPHVLKHTMVTLSMRAGLSSFDIAEICNTDERTLRRVYGHHDPKRAAKNVGAWAR